MLTTPCICSSVTQLSANVTHFWQGQARHCRVMQSSTTRHTISTTISGIVKGDRGGVDLIPLLPQVIEPQHAATGYENISYSSVSKKTQWWSDSIQGGMKHFYFPPEGLSNFFSPPTLRCSA